eukprot:9955207-Alexandrium_andersonii.AAC.1
MSELSATPVARTEPHQELWGPNLSPWCISGAYIQGPTIGATQSCSFRAKLLFLPFLPALPPPRPARATVQNDPWGAPGRALVAH